MLVARAPSDPAAFPRSITVGVDGSVPARRAYDVASRLASVTGADLRCVVALGGKGADLAAVSAQIPDVPLAAADTRRPLDALLAAAESSDLLVVGHRGLHGLRALGSISERLVARAPTSVLVVRGA